jgi:hypothetical protein
MPTTISFAGPNQPKPTQAPQGKLRNFAATAAAPPKDSIHFSGGTTPPATDVQAPAPTPEKAPAEGNWFTKRCKTIGPAIGAAFHGGNWMSLPFKGWKADLLQSTVITLPLTILPGSQLILIPTWIAIGAMARTAWGLAKGMWNPEKVIAEVAEKKAQKEVEKNKIA